MDTLPVPSPTSGHDVPSPPVGEADGTSRSARATSPAIDLDAAVAHLNALAAGDALDTALATGRYLVDTFFDGDVCAFERPRAPGRISLRQLAGRSDLEASHCTLCRDIGILGQSLLLPRAGYPNLKLSHHCALLAVRDVASKLALARCSEANDWSSRQLAEESGRAKAEASGPPRRGRPSVPKFVKAARQVAAMSRQITSIPCDEAALRRFTFSLSAEALETGRASAVELSVWFEAAAMRADELLVRLMQEDEAGEEGVAVDAAVEPRRAAAGELQRCNSPAAARRGSTAASTATPSSPASSSCINRTSNSSARIAAASNHTDNSTAEARPVSSASAESENVNRLSAASSHGIDVIWRDMAATCRAALTNFGTLGRPRRGGPLASAFARPLSSANCLELQSFASEHRARASLDATSRTASRAQWCDSFRLG
jgi:hypothetical protein